MSESSAKNDVESIESSSPIEKVRTAIIPDNIITCTPERTVECNEQYEAKRQTPKVPEFLKDFMSQGQGPHECKTPECPKILYDE
jgi:hypothetical protein